MSAVADRRHGLLPRGAERRLLGRFYCADFLRYALDVVLPFQFVYLYLVLDWSEWALLPFVLYSGVFLILEVATGIWADRYGRKPLTLAGNGVNALALAAVPLVATLHGGEQLVAVCVTYAVMGLGESLRSGSEEAWVVDNLVAARRTDLLEVYFARTWSLTSAGGVVAGTLAVLLLFLLPVSRGIIDLLWVIAGLAALVAAGTVLGVPEKPVPEGGVLGGSVLAGREEPARRVAPAEPRADVALTVEAVTAREDVELRDVLLLLRRTAGLLTFLLAYTVASFSGGSVDEAFDLALVTRGLDARAFALLGIAADLVGVGAPLIGLWLARRLGARRAMAALLVAPAVMVTVVLIRPGIALLVMVAVLLDLCDSAWDPVALGHLHREVPSRFRATVASTFEQAAGFAEIASLGLFTVVLGEQGRALREATPDLVDAFSGGAPTPAPVPTGFLGLPIPDLAILMFVLSGLVAVPLLLHRTGVLAQRVSAARRRFRHRLSRKARPSNSSRTTREDQKPQPCHRHHEANRDGPARWRSPRPAVWKRCSGGPTS